MIRPVGFQTMPSGTFTARLVPSLLALALKVNAATSGVMISDETANYVLSNSEVVAVVSKQTGDLNSLKYQGLEMVGGKSGHAHGYWSHAPGLNSTVVDSITIDPKNNGGERGEISIRVSADGKNIGKGPGGSTIADIEIRYAMSATDSGVYTYSIFSHPASYPATQVGEARFAAKLTPELFDFMTVDARRRKLMPRPEDWDKGTQLNMQEARLLNTGQYKGEVEHKYDYTSVQFDTPASGWSSTGKKIGLWFINPTIEYLSGGPTKVEFSAHLDASPSGGAAPTLLNYWRGSHYGGSSCVIAAGESWNKVVGPFLIYCNSAATPEAQWTDALNKAKDESSAWPYHWVQGVDYPHREDRGVVSGRLVLRDPQAPNVTMANILVGLSMPAYKTQNRRGVETVEWQNDAKHYQFWVRADNDGTFSIPNIRPGVYTLYAIADGVLGEFSKANISVGKGEKLQIGDLVWVPVRYGRQLWEVGTPDRTAGEFKHGDHYWQWGLYLRYPKEFPNDVNFIIGRSNPRTDWNYAQVPRAQEDDPIGKKRGSSTTWKVTFDMPKAQRGRAILRLALAGNSARTIDISVNGERAGSTGPLPDTAVIRRDGIRGLWMERDVIFDAALLKAGTNVIGLSIPEAGVMSGVEYDYLRLELDESGRAAPLAVEHAVEKSSD